MSAENLHLDYPETADIETSSEDYARRFSGEIGEWFLAVQEEMTIEMLGSYPHATVLDVGGGHGQLTRSLLEHGYTVTVFGSSDVCKARIQELIDQDRCRFQSGNILSLPYPDQAFDVVISYRLLPHVDRWRPLLAELGRVARNAVLVDYPSVRSLNCFSPLLFGMKKRWEGNTRTFTLFHESEIVNEFRSLGFSRARRGPEFFLPMVLHRAMKAPLISKIAEGISRVLGLTSVFGSPVILKFVRTKEGRR
jgi:2-polyprenyl-3-methyl-5-hydroxy-6-metoxy-1,4-benzoquinol methylase